MEEKLNFRMRKKATLGVFVHELFIVINHALITLLLLAYNALFS